MQPRLIIHGGAGRAMRDPSRAPVVRDALLAVIDEVYPTLLAGVSAGDVVRHACRLLEDDPNFNAGTGGCLQVDGKVRLSAAFMDGGTQSFSAIINGNRIRNPIELAAYLQNHDDRVLASEGVDELCRELGLEIWDNITERRLQEWIAERNRDFARDTAAVAAEASEDARTGTIGAVALDVHGVIAAGTSTGGRGFERIGRVSDSATPAGNYANAFAGVSATGVGEHILDEALACTIVVRRADGATLEQAMRRTMDGAESRGRVLGAIAVDRDGAIVAGKTSDILLAAYATAQTTGHTIELPTGTVVIRF